MSTTDRSRVLLWAARAQRMSAEAHKRGDFIACARLLETARRYRRAAGVSR